jgi:hypothetical protein
MDFESFYLFDRLLLLAFSLLVIGDPLRYLIAKYTTLFRGLDFAQIFIVDVYLAGLILYAVAMIPLHLFNIYLTIGLLSACCVFSIKVHFEKLKKLSHIPRTVTDYTSKHRAKLLKNLLVFGMFLSLLWIEIIPLSNFVFGNVYDSSLFGLFVQLNIRHQQTPVTMQPFGAEGIIYPQGFFVIEAFTCNLFGFSSAEITLRITPFFMALIVLGAYYLGREFSPSSHLDLSLAFTFWCISRWPRLLFWGSNAFVAGFPLYFVALSQLPRLTSLQKGSFARKNDALTFLTISVLFGYLAAIHLVFFELLFALVVLTVLFNFLRERKEILPKLRNFAVFCVFSFIPICVSVYRFIAWHPYVGNNLGLPSDVVLISEEWAGGVPLSVIVQRLGNWIFVSDWISPHLVIGYLILGLSISGTIATVLLRNDRSFSQVKKTVKMALVVAAASFSLILLTTNELLSLLPQLTQFAMLTVQVAEMAILAIVALFFMVAVFNLMLFSALQRILSSGIHIERFGSIRIRLQETLHKKLSQPRKPARKTIIALFLILTVIYGPFLYYFFSADVNYADGQYKMFCTTTEDDYQLMQWIRDNLPLDSIILINPHESGGFIPCISGHRVIYSPGASRYSFSYGVLVDLISNHELNGTVYEFAKALNITHVFVGSSATPGRERWDPLLFLGNPNFRLLKNIGQTYLFEINNRINLDAVFASDFENRSLSADGWIVASSSNDGVGSAVLVSGYGVNGETALKISAKSTGGGYWCSAYRDIYVPSNSNVFLSFYINAADGFEGSDNLMVILSDTNWTRQLYLEAIPNRVGKSVLAMPMREGSYQFNISRLWKETYSSILPTQFHLQILNYDDNGVENVAYVNNVEVKVNGPPSAAIRFWDNFEHGTLASSEWLMSSQGNGLGLVAKVDDQFADTKRLRMDSKSIHGSYWISIYRSIKLYWNSSSVMLRFKLDATIGFGDKDGLAIIVCEPSWDRHAYLATNPNATPVNHPISPTGLQEVNISDVWRNLYNQPLPETFFLQLLNIDTDGVKNVAYVDLVQIEIPGSSIDSSD